MPGLSHQLLHHVWRRRQNYRDARMKVWQYLFRLSTYGLYQLYSSKGNFSAMVSFCKICNHALFATRVTNYNVTRHPLCSIHQVTQFFVHRRTYTMLYAPYKQYRNSHDVVGPSSPQGLPCLNKILPAVFVWLHHVPPYREASLHKGGIDVAKNLYALRSHAST